MSSFAIKLNPSVKELEIWLLKISFGVLFVVFGIFGVFSDVCGATIFTDDFETYDLGVLSGQGGWEDTSHKTDVVDTQKVSGGQGIELHAEGIVDKVKKTGTPQCIGSI
ncbi:unnamed protein product, partial [marine sediment metagenome]